MAPQEAPDMLRVVTQRLSSTPVKQLPHVAPYLAVNIAHNGQALAKSSKDDKLVGRTDSALIVHKLKTQLSALLQDKNREARYAAVILIRATVEVGGWNVLQGVGAWVRDLVGLLGVSEKSKIHLGYLAVYSHWFSLDRLFFETSLLNPSNVRVEARPPSHQETLYYHIDQDIRPHTRTPVAG